jgi:hypothetical protein
MATVFQLSRCAAQHLRDYLDPAGGRAFATYDRVGDAATLLPADCFAPALLNAPLTGREVRAMYQPDGPFRHLRDTMQAVLADERACSSRFEEQDLDSPDGPWALIRAALVASDSTPGIKASKVTKILHRKRPRLVPIFDSKVASFYEVSTRMPSKLWPLLKVEIANHGPWLSGLANSYSCPDGRAITSLRVLDIVVWEHVVTACQAARQNQTGA